jgi:hypothetical protein
MGYPAKKRHPEWTAPQAIASFPSKREEAILKPPYVRPAAKTKIDAIMMSFRAACAL